MKVLPQAKSGKPGAEEGFRDILDGPEDSNRDINISFYGEDRDSGHGGGSNGEGRLDARILTRPVRRAAATMNGTAIRPANRKSTNDEVL